MSKPRVWFTACAALAAVGLLSIGTANAQWGTITGRVTVTGKLPQLPVLVKKGDANVRDGSVCAAADIPDESRVSDPESQGLANVLIWPIKKPTQTHPDLEQSRSKEVALTVKGCRFIPHMLIVRTDQRVRVFSKDAVTHNVHSSPVKNNSQNFIVPPNESTGILLSPMTMGERLPFQVTNDIHPWTRAYFLVLDHPYAAVTNEKGEFEIANLPEGEHTFIVWQEKVGYLEKIYKVTVKPGQNKLDPITVPAEKFVKND